MPKVFLSLLLFAGLLLLPGCSNAEAEACDAAKKAVSEYELSYNPKFVMAERLESEDKRNFEKWLKAIRDGVQIPRNNVGDEARELRKEAQKEYFKSQLVIVNNPSCFTPEQVVDAQIATNND